MFSYFIRRSMLVLGLFISVAGWADGNSHHNLTSNAIGNAIGFFNLEYSYKITNYWTLGVRGASGKATLSETEIRGNSFGSIARYYFKPALQDNSWYLAVSADRENFDAHKTVNSVVYGGASSGVTFAAGGGYQWFWKSFNIGFGLLLKSKQKIELNDGAGNSYKDGINTMFAIDFTIGGKF